MTALVTADQSIFFLLYLLKMGESYSCSETTAMSYFALVFFLFIFFWLFSDAAFEFRASYKTLSNVFERLHLTWQLTVRWGDARTGLVAHCKSRHTPWCFSQPALCTGRLWFHSFMWSCFVGMQPMFMIKDRSARSEWHRCATYPASLTPTLISIHWSRVGKVNSLTHLS